MPKRVSKCERIRVHDPDQRVPLSKIPAIVERITGSRPHAATIHRWRIRGLRDVRLRTEFCGGRRHSCERWVREFFAAVTAAADGEPSPAAQGVKRDRSIELAAKELESQGM